MKRCLIIASLRMENEPRCPKCGAVLIRIPRRFADRVVSLVKPLVRLACRGLGCGWEGTVSAKRAKNFTADYPKSRD